MEFRDTSYILWRESDKAWELYLDQINTATANIGIPAKPYVYRVYFSLKKLSEFSEFTSVPGYVSADADGKKAILEAYLQSEASFSRVATREDSVSILSRGQLAAKLESYIDSSRYTDLTYTKVNSSTGANEPNTSMAILDEFSENYGELEVQGAFPYRDNSTAHVPVEGYYYFKYETLKLQTPSFDEAVKYRDRIEYYLNGYTREYTSKTSPLSAGFIATIPKRTFSPGATNVENVLVGDLLRISISGGSGEYLVEHTYETLPRLEEVQDNTWRVIQGVGSLTPGEATLTVTDTSTQEQVTLSASVVLPIDSLYISSGLTINFQ